MLQSWPASSRHFCVAGSHLTTRPTGGTPPGGSVSAGLRMMPGGSGGDGGGGGGGLVGGWGRWGPAVGGGGGPPVVNTEGGCGGRPLARLRAEARARRAA